MENNNAFTDGNIPGGLTSTTEIKVLICYLASKNPDPTQQNLLIDALTLEGLANYFEITAAISSLMENGQIVLENDCIHLLDEGEQIYLALLDEVPKSVLHKAETAFTRVLSLYKNKSETDVQIIKVSDGYLVRCSVVDIGTDLFSVSLFAPTRQQAKMIEENFLKDPGRLYQYNLFLLTGEDYTR